MPNKTLSLLAPCLLVGTLGCGGSDSNNSRNNTTNNTNNNSSNNTNNNSSNNTNNNSSNNNSGLACPQAQSLTVCDLKLDGGAAQPQLGDPVALEQVVVTTPRFTIIPATEESSALVGFFVQDVVTTDELDGRFSGIQVTYREDNIQGQLPDVGDVIRVEGTFRDFGQDGGARQKQLSATFLGDAQSVMPATPKALDDPSQIATGGMLADDYEGVLLTISDVNATVVRDVPGAGGSSIFGAFMVTGSLVVSGTLYQPARVTMGERFNSITGVLRLGTAPFDAGISLFTPRGPEDVDRANPPQTTTSIVALQDDSDPNHPTLCVSMGQTQGTCPLVDFTGVTVTAVDAYVSANLRAMWIQDTSVADGRFAGVKVVYSANETNVPAIGNKIDISGEAIDFYNGRQVQFSDWTIVDAGTSTITPVVVDPSMLARDSTAANPYEGVLVRVENVSVTQACVEASNGRDFGNFLVTGNVFLGNAFNYDYNGDSVSTAMCDMPNVDCSCGGMSRPNDMRMMGDTFSSITGIMNFAFDDLRLEPRGNDDIQQ